LHDLQEQGVLVRDTERYYRATGQGTINHAYYQAIQDSKLTDLEAMMAYGTTDSCRMQYLCRFLGDEQASECGECDRCRKAALAPPSESLFAQVSAFAHHPPLNLTGVYQKQPIYEMGYALSYYGGTEIGEVIHRCKYENSGTLPDWVIDQAVAFLRSRFPLSRISAVVPFPPSKSGGFVEDFAKRLAEKLQIPFQPILRKTRDTDPQKNFTNQAQKQANIEGAIQCLRSLRGENLLVVDDIFDSGASLKEAGKILKQSGSGALYAFCLARTRHRGDI
ncbi:MAG: phosphoribosyltransferase family protein, partial [Fimbriimonadales bacterium]